MSGRQPGEGVEFAGVRPSTLPWTGRQRGKSDAADAVAAALAALNGEASGVPKSHAGAQYCIAAEWSWRALTAAAQPGTVTSCHSPPLRLRLLPKAWPGKMSPK